MNTLRVLFLGDVVGEPGKMMVQKYTSELKKKYAIDAIIINGENSADTGRGITLRDVQFFKNNGADVITTGNHIWQQKEIYNYLTQHTDVVRPANFPAGCPGTGVTTFVCNGITIGIINVQGRIFMREYVDCPFRTVESILTYLKTKTNIIFVDLHAETTSEKAAMAYYFDGSISGLVGTHSHVQTADERILPKGTAFITDLGMAGAVHSSIGMQKESVIQNFLTQMPTKFVVEDKGPMQLCGAWIEVDTKTGKALKIERIKIVDETILVDK